MFCFEGWFLVLIASVPGLCIRFTFSLHFDKSTPTAQQNDLPYLLTGVCVIFHYNIIVQIHESVKIPNVFTCQQVMLAMEI